MKRIFSIFLLLSILVLSLQINVFAGNTFDQGVIEEKSLTNDQLIEKIDILPETEFLSQVKYYLSQEFADLSEESQQVHILVLNDSDGQYMLLEDFLDESINNYKKSKIDKKSKTQLNNDDFSLSSSNNAVIITEYVSSDFVYKKARYRVTYSAYIGDQADYVKVTSRLQNATSRNGSYTERATKTQNLQVGGYVTAETSISTTNYWRGTFTASAYVGSSVVGTINGTSSVKLYNRNASPYPSHTDFHSGKVMTEPNVTNWNIVPAHLRTPALTSTERGQYITWYIDTYGAPSWDWADYDIHHIKPREYGGTHAYSNLIPLLRTFHQQTVNPWFNAY